MYKKWEELMANGSGELLGAPLSFKSMNKGELIYEGELNGKVIFCTASESCISDYDYSNVEVVSSVTQGEYVFLAFDGVVILNTH